MKRGYLVIFILFIIPSAGFAQSLSLADSLHKIGMKYYDEGRYPQASIYLGRAFHLYKKRSADSTWIPAGLDYATALTDQAKLKPALQLLRLLNKTSYQKHHPQLQANIEDELGMINFFTNQFQKALIHFNKALRLGQKLNNQHLVSTIYNNKGTIFFRRGDYQSSIEAWKKALVILQKKQNKKNTAILLNNMGVVYEKIDLLKSAQKYFNQSLAIQKKLDNVVLLAITYNHLADVYMKMGSFNKALTNYQKSLKFSKEAGIDYRRARILNNIGLLNKKLGQNQKALAYYRKSLKLREQFSNSIKLAGTYKNIGDVFWESGKQKKAIRAYQKALSLIEQAGAPGDIANSLYDLAKVELASRRISDFSRYMQHAHTITDTLQNPHLLTRRYMLLAKYDSLKNHPRQAIHQYKKAVQQSSKISSVASIIPLEKLARAFWPSHPDSAIYYGRKAIRIIEMEQSRTSTIKRFQGGYFKQFAPFYVDMASWIYHQNHNIPVAYKLMEMGKSRVLIQQLAQRAQFGPASLPEKERIKQAQQLSDIAALRRQLHRLDSQKKDDEEKKQKIKTEIRNKQLNYDAFINRLHQENPHYKSYKKPEPVSVDKVQAICPSGTAVLEYALSQNRLLTFFITPDRVQVKIFPLKKDSSSGLILKKEVNRFRQAIIKRASRNTLSKLSKPLYKRLLAPFQSQINRFKNLLVIPSGFLAYLPFDALIHKNHYLITKYDIKYAPSMTSFELMQKPNTRSFGNVLAIGNSTIYPKTMHAPALAGVDLEMRSINKTFSNASVIKGDNLSEKNVRRLLKNSYSVVHIATHSIINEKKPSLSGIIVGRRKGGNNINNDGFLSRSEISRLNISSNLVVLSACKTAAGPVIGGEGMLGLQQAFFMAGVSSVIVSLWNVYDRATARLMKNFYHSLKINHNSWSESWDKFLRWIEQSDAVPFGEPAEAMHQAKLKLLHSPAYQDPVFWAPFIVIGR